MTQMTRKRPLSRAERLALLGGALLLALAAVPMLHEALEYRRAALAAEPWRVLTAHLVHVNWLHAVINAIGWVAVARLFDLDLDAGEQSGALLLGALAITAGLALVYPSIAWYRGFSGALHALFFAGACAWLLRSAAARARSWSEIVWPAALLAGGWIKVTIEQPGGSLTPYAEWLGAHTVPQSHLLGAAAGTAFGMLCALRRCVRG